MPIGVDFHSTRFEFRYGPTTRVIEDPENHLRYGYGELPDTISVTDGKRLIVFDSQKAVLKSKTDSVDVHPESVQHKGYMGVWSGQSDYIVDSDGQLQIAR